ncbi:hypothetical protein ACS0TY_009119 [Phlomoides rotata]
MVLGLRSKHRRGASVKVDYVVHLDEIKPWPPSESLRSVQTVFLQWENGSQKSGSFLSSAQDSKLVFNESFKLPLILHPDKKVHDKFQKNYLEFSLFAPRKDKAKGQLLGTAHLNLADYGVIENILSINVPVNFKKSANNLVQSALVISLEPVDQDSANSSNNVGLSKAASLDNDNDDLEIASITDDDASSQSSRTAGSSTFEVGTSSPSQIEKHVYGYAGFDPEQKTNGRALSTDASSETTHGSDSISFSKFYERSVTAVKKNSETPLLRSSLSSVQGSVSLDSDVVVAKSKRRAIGNTQEDKSSEEFAHEAVAISANNYGKDVDEIKSVYSYSAREKELSSEDEQINDAQHAGLVNVEKKSEQKDTESDDDMGEMSHSPETKLFGNVSEDPVGGNATDIIEKEAAVSLPSNNKARLEHRDSSKGNGLPSDIYAGGKELHLETPDGFQKRDDSSAVIEGKEPQVELSDCKNEWKMRVEMLEEELREAAATEIGLYSAVTEHASSANKVHTPARRLSRFYTNACKGGSQAKRASAARAAVSGLVLVSKSCGHDVPRLTFWLSNVIMLRAIVSQTAAEFPHSDGTGVDESDDREDVSAFITALEKVESWLFSRTVESLWWQTFTPHMQPTIAKGTDVTSGSGGKKTCGRRNSLVNNEQGNFSTELWTKAFKDARERLCPLRAGGHECGCLSVLVRLVMEQLVDRLDVAMFNAILRESAEEMPTDPLSDPITDSKVLPIPAGKSSFGAGVELKNSIGNWSRWLTDLFGLEDDSTEHSGHGKKSKSFKAFRLLHSLSDLMMLPFGMLADASTRKEVCPMFGPRIIERVLSSFVPDEFCPDPIPQEIIDALETEEVDSEDLLNTFPCTASPTKYTPPPAALLTCVEDVGNQVLRSSRLSSLKKMN